MAVLTERVRAALRRSGYDPAEIRETEERVRAGEIVVELDHTGEARIVPVTSAAPPTHSKAAEEWESWK